MTNHDESSADQELPQEDVPTGESESASGVEESVTTSKGSGDAGGADDEPLLPPPVAPVAPAGAGAKHPHKMGAGAVLGIAGITLLSGVIGGAVGGAIAGGWHGHGHGAEHASRWHGGDNDGWPGGGVPTPMPTPMPGIGNGGVGATPGGAGSGVGGSVGGGSVGGGSSYDQGSTPSGTSDSSATVRGVVNIKSSDNYHQSSGAGTGVVIGQNGLVLTNNHVVDGATSITVSVPGSTKSYPAKVLGYSVAKDLALLSLSGVHNMATASLGLSKNVAVGDSVMGVGNAGGMGLTWSASGTVTATNSSVTANDPASGQAETLTGVIKTDAPIQPGDSGGPLLDSSGKVIGIDVAGGADNSGQTGYAIPIDTALSLAHDIQANKVTGDIHIGETAFMGVNIDASKSGEALVVGVVAGGPASKAGIAAGDVIVKIDGVAVSGPKYTAAAVTKLHPGDKVTVSYSRGGMMHTTTVLLGSGPAH